MSDDSQATKRFAGLTVLVTGATSGIGRETVGQLASAGATVLVHGRSRERVDSVVKELRANGGDAKGVVADLSSLAEAAQLAGDACAAAERPIDVLVNNAGVGFGQDRKRREVSRDGLELRFAVNYLAPFVLGHELRSRRAPTRAVINVASIGQAPLDLDDLLATRGYDGVDAYCKSKLALIMLTFDWAAALAPVVCNALHPGTYLDTGMVRTAGIAPLGPASRGADAILGVLGASLEDGTSGDYFDERRPARANPQAYDAGVRRTLHERTVEMIRRFVPRAPL